MSDSILPDQLLPLGPRIVDLLRRTVAPVEGSGAAALRLTRTETAILRLLCSRAPATVSRAELLRSLWNLDERSSRTLDTHITRLRRKLEDDPAAPRYLLTVYRVGYRLELPAEGPGPTARAAPPAFPAAPLRNAFPPAFPASNSSAHAS